MSKKPIQPSLFRFVTLRSPQAIEDKETAPGFITPSQSVQTASAYYQAVAGVSEGDEAGKKSALEGVDLAGAGNLLESKTAIKGISEDLYAFSSWLMRNKDVLSYQSIADNLPSTYLSLDLSNQTQVDLYGITLDDTEEAQIWDNLFHQTLNRTSIQIRETLIQMLVTNQFVKAFKTFYDNPPAYILAVDVEVGEIASFSEEDEKEFRKRGNASVVIEKQVLLSNKTEDTTIEGDIPESTEKYLQGDLDNTLAKERIRVLQNALTEIEKEERAYHIENQNQYRDYVDLYDQDVKDQFDLETPVLEDYYDPDRQMTIQVKTYPDFIQPKFNYTPVAIDFQSPTGATFVRTTTTAPIFLSQATRDLLSREEFSSYSEFSTLKLAIKECISFDEKALLKNPSTSTKKVSIGRSKVTIDPSLVSSVRQYCYSGNLERRVSFGVNEFTISINMMVGRDNPYVVSSNLSLTSKELIE